MIKLYMTIALLFALSACSAHGGFSLGH